MEARWSRSNAGRDMVPEDMQGDAGFVVMGRTLENQSLVPLTWPNANLDEVITEARSLQEKSVRDLSIAEPSGLGYTFDQQTQDAWQKIAQLDKQYQGQAALLDLARSVGMEKTTAYADV